ncbi:MAG: cytochrome c [Deltaproteobacteria bacterium]|nr:cytochrome c [Deltaproteobacteria bacterium]
MKISSVLLLLGVFLFAGLAYAETFAAKEYFERKCVSCHAADGGGDVDKAKFLGVTIDQLNLVKTETINAKRENLKTVLLDGKNSMPAYRKLKEGEVDALIDYMLGLGRGIAKK